MTARQDGAGRVVITASPEETAIIIMAIHHFDSAGINSERIVKDIFSENGDPDLLEDYVNSVAIRCTARNILKCLKQL